MKTKQEGGKNVVRVRMNKEKLIQCIHMEVYLILIAVVLVMNMIPAFMPPTWSVLAFFYISYELSLLPVVVLGALSATAGRIILYGLARGYLRRFFSRKAQENMDALGTFFKNHQQLTIPAVVGYAFFPIPSNQIFIAAGLAKLDIVVIAASFFMGRLFSYTGWVVVAHKASEHFDNLFSSHFTHPQSLVIEFLSLGSLFLIFSINWKSLVPTSSPRKTHKKKK